jgi:Smr domain
MENRNILYLGFIPNADTQGQFKSMDVHLHNTFTSGLKVNLKMIISDEIIYEKNENIPGDEGIFMHQIQYADLEFRPVFEIKAVYSIGEKPVETTKTIKIKIASFHKKYRMVPWFKIKVFVYEVLDINDFLNEDSENHLEEINTLAKKGIGHLAGQRKNEVIKKAHFADHIDLHIEQLIHSQKKLSNREILKVQVAAFLKYIDEALQHHQVVVYAIHGVGDGVLKKRIHEILDHHPHIAFYKNEYHPKYGYGATEIHFK